jgi:5'-3' exonuclease
MLSDRELHVLDVPKLAESIRDIIGETKLSDYIFMTLFLGNDFMPHFPALNLRTTGFDTLFKTYTSTLLPNEHLFDTTIQWNHVRKFIDALALQEETLFIKEYHARNRYRVDTSDENRVNNLPMIQREQEHIICPIKPKWQERYYTSFFKQSPNDICKNYIDMLAWNMQYYTTGCTNWNMHYLHMYPPLLEDLVKYVPSSHTIEPDKTILTEKELLTYVLPPVYYQFIPDGTSQESKMPKLVWSYCRYIWESHVCYNEFT